ncbi:uncharacterized protein LOC108910995 [Anoplophora glabripennis]|uniref:uncharacterized protein LOC108910995 n=1 Tax=Anoplophora glabripennis TaxID=217634 RepID=UPI0008746C63|nr:uncharacterized protein LOC108910995 [Anoplophora glabripennis]
MLLCLIFGICLGLTCAQDKQNNATKVEEELYHPNVSFSDTFDWRLFKELAGKYKNVLLSPVSVKLILALLYQGSSGSTEKEFQNVLQFIDKKTVDDNYHQILLKLQASERNEYLLNMGTSVFLDSQIPANPNYESKVSRYYGTEIKPISFTDSTNASHTINLWVDKITNGKISNIVKAGDLQQTIMLVANAVYFKGTWEHQFPKNQTYFGKFFVNAENINNMETLSIPYMSTTDTFFMKESKELDSKILRLPYKGSGYSMFIILPNSLGGLPNLIKGINLEKLSSLLRSLEKRLVEVHIPKLKYSFKTKMSEALRNVGLRQMFENTASFPNITKNNNWALIVSDIIQKTGIELDEEGSVVYSATGVNIGNKFGEPKENFHATHPFLFFIEGPNGIILFNGKIENPSETETIAVDVTKEPSLNTIAAQVFSTAKQSAAAASQNVPLPTSSASPDLLNIQPNVSPQFPNLEPANTDIEVADMQELSNRFSLFDMELLNVFSETTTNVLLSSASIKTTLAMILEGAQGNCAVEIREALRIPDINLKGVRAILVDLLNTLEEKSYSTYLENSNAIFVSDKYKIIDKYQNTIGQFYGGNVNTISFKNVGGAVNIINNWVAKATHDNIKEIIGSQSISPDTTAVIVNALFFKGKWKTAFDSKVTQTKCFRTANGCISTPMMRVSSNFNNSYIRQLRARAIEIPYEHDFSMLILLPSEEANVRSVIRDLQHFKLVDILNELKPSDITLEIPKFRFDYSSDLVEHLKPLKIREIFGPQANLSGIVENGNVLINSLVHKTRIEVDEEGTIAAAATGAIVIPLMGSTSIVADKPFIFYIHHQQTIIFEGILTNPQESSHSTESRTVGTRNQNFEIGSLRNYF